jgi:hypothetical protein
VEQLSFTALLSAKDREQLVQLTDRLLSQTDSPDFSEPVKSESFKALFRSPVPIENNEKPMLKGQPPPPAMDQTSIIDRLPAVEQRRSTALPLSMLENANRMTEGSETAKPVQNPPGASGSSPSSFQSEPHAAPRDGADPATEPTIPERFGGSPKSGPAVEGWVPKALSVPPSSPEDPIHTAMVRSALIHLKTIFEPPALNESVKTIQEWLPTLLEDSGLFFEKKIADILSMQNRPSNQVQSTQAETNERQPILSGESENAAGSMRTDISSDSGQTAVRVATRDLKPQLLVLKAYLELVDPQIAENLGLKTKDTAFMREAVSDMLGHLEQHQEGIIQRSGDSYPFLVVYHSLPLKEQGKPLRLKIYYPKKRPTQNEDAHHRVALLLEMDRLGPVRTDLAMQGNRLQITFFVRDITVQSMFERQMDHVQTALKHTFGQVQLAVHVSKEKIVQFENEDSLQGSVGRIDIKA